MNDVEILDGLADTLAAARNAILEATNQKRPIREILAMIAPIGEIADLLASHDDGEASGSSDDYGLLVGLEAKREFMTTAQIVVLEIVASGIARDAQDAILETQRSLVQAFDKCGRDIARLAHTHIDVKGLIH